MEKSSRKRTRVAYQEDKEIASKRDGIVRLYGLQILTDLSNLPSEKPLCVSEMDWDELQKIIRSGKRYYDFVVHPPSHHPSLHPSLPTGDDEMKEEMVPITVVVHNTYASIAYARIVGGPKLKSTGKVATNTQNDWWRKDCPILGLFGKIHASTRPNQCHHTTKFTITVPSWFVKNPFIQSSMKTENVNYIFCILSSLMADIVDNILSPEDADYLRNEPTSSFRFNSIETIKMPIEDAIITSFERIRDALEDEAFIESVIKHVQE